MRKLMIGCAMLLLMAAAFVLPPGGTALAGVAPPALPTAGAPVSGTLGATGQSAEFEAQAALPVRVSLSGTWEGTVKVQRSYDGGSTWFDMTVGGSPWAVFTANADEAIDQPAHDAVRYRIDFARTSGTLTYELGN